MNTRPLNPACIALACGLLPLLVGHAAYLISAFEGFVPWCLPYWDGCTSISRAARHGWANHLFKAGMLPLAGLMLVFWWLASAWAAALGAARRPRLAMLLLGATGALFLVLYATFLGVEGALYQWLRRYGITFHFAFTVLAQMLLLRLVQHAPQVSLALRRGLLLLLAAMLLLGLASLPLQHLMGDRDAWVNRLEWCFALLMIAVFPLVGWGWRRSGFVLSAQLQGRCENGREAPPA